ncbi:MAG: response regulator transcription factor [Bacteroidetes bacterium]|nr:response regulator transcription factor [Bacteroidota bacterium]
MKAVIVEDESLAAKRLETLIKKCNKDIEILTHLPSVKSAVKWFSENPQPDLIFMDIHLEDGLSFSIFEQAPIQAPVIFTTAFDEYTIKAFKVNSIDYLLKPINQEDLSQSLTKFHKLRSGFSTGTVDIRAIIEQLTPKEEQYKTRFLVSEGSSYLTIDIQDVAYFFAEDKFAFLVSKAGKHYIIDLTLDKLTGVLNPKLFYRINRQFIVSTASIENMTKYSANKLKLNLNPPTDKDVFVSQDKYTDFKKWLDN